MPSSRSAQVDTVSSGWEGQGDGDLVIVVVVEEADEKEEEEEEVAIDVGSETTLWG